MKTMSQDNGLKKCNLSPLYRLERNTNFKSLLIFSLVTAAMIVLAIGMYGMMTDVMESVISAFGEETATYLEEIMGSNDFNSYFIMHIGEWWGLFAVIYGSFLGYQLVAANFRNNSSTMLYSLNLTRNNILNTKFVRLTINSVLFNIFLGITSLAGVFAFGYSVNILNLCVYTLFMLIITLLSGLIMFAVTVLLPKKLSPVLSIVLPIILVFFSSLALMDKNLDFFAYFSPISLAFTTGPKNILTTGFADVNYYILALWTILPVVLTIIAYKKFGEKDLI